MALLKIENLVYVYSLLKFSIFWFTYAVLREQKPTLIFWSVLFSTFSYPSSVPADDWNWASGCHSDTASHYVLPFTSLPGVVGWIIYNTVILQESIIIIIFILRKRKLKWEKLTYASITGGKWENQVWT